MDKGVVALISIIVICYLFTNLGSSDPGQTTLESAMEKAESGKAMEMSVAEAGAYRRKQEADSYSNRQRITIGLTAEEKALRDYEDAAILRGDTKSTPEYEELQRRARESRQQ